MTLARGHATADSAT